MYWRHTKKPRHALHLSPWIRVRGVHKVFFFFSGGGEEGRGGGGKCFDEVVLIMLSIHVHLKFTVLTMQTTYQSK